MTTHTEFTHLGTEASILSRAMNVIFTKQATLISIQS
jgi:hypothetical protein